MGVFSTQPGSRKEQQLGATVGCPCGEREIVFSPLCLDPSTVGDGQEQADVKGGDTAPFLPTHAAVRAYQAYHFGSDVLHMSQLTSLSHFSHRQSEKVFIPRWPNMRLGESRVRGVGLQYNLV